MKKIRLPKFNERRQSGNDALLTTPSSQKASAHSLFCWKGNSRQLDFEEESSDNWRVAAQVCEQPFLDEK